VESLTFNNRRKCFGTREFSRRSGICKSCPYFEECGEIVEKIENDYRNS